jgi:predicted small metal-binding protein
MSANKVQINDYLTFFVNDEDMPELFAWLNEHSDTQHDITEIHNEIPNTFKGYIKYRQLMESQNDDIRMGQC